MAIKPLISDPLSVASGGGGYWLTSQIQSNCASPTEGATRFTNSTNISMMASGTSFRGVLSDRKCSTLICSKKKLWGKWPSKGLMNAHNTHHPVSCFKFCFSSEQKTWSQSQFDSSCHFLCMPVDGHDASEIFETTICNGKIHPFKHPGIFTTNLNWFARISEPSTVLSLNAAFCSRLVGFFPGILFCYAVLSNFDDILLMAEILHHLGCMKPVVNNGINYQPQLVRFRRISAINSIMQISLLSQGNPSYPPQSYPPQE